MMHHHTTLGKILCFLAGLLQSLAAIIVGLHAFNIDVFALPFVQSNLHAVVKPVQIVIGIAGILGIIYLVSKCGECEKHDSHHHSHHPK